MFSGDAKVQGNDAAWMLVA